MKKILLPSLTLVLLIASAFTFLAGIEYTVTSDSVIHFESKDPSGSFSEVSGTVFLDEAAPESSKFYIVIGVKSIKTGNGMRDKKALTNEYFDAAKYPNIVFTSTKVQKSGDGYQVVGNLKMKGVTKVYSIPAKFVKNSNGGDFTGTFNVNRIDFGVGESSKIIPDIMKISFKLPVKQK